MVGTCPEGAEAGAHPLMWGCYPAFRASPCPPPPAAPPYPVPPAAPPCPAPVRGAGPWMEGWEVGVFGHPVGVFKRLVHHLLLEHVVEEHL